MTTPTKRSAKARSKQEAMLAATDKDRERFWRKVNKTEGCWIWTGSTEHKGYGSFSISCRAVRAHRVSYLWANGSLPEDRMVCHSCDNPPCVNPAHLFLGDNTANMRDASAKKRLVGQDRTHCPHGHEYTPENTLIKKGGRVCRACRKVQDGIRCAKQRAANAAHLAEQKRLGIVPMNAKIVKPGTHLFHPKATPAKKTKAL